MTRNNTTRRPDPVLKQRNRRLLVAGLALFVIVDVALVAVALSNGRVSDATADTARPALTNDAAAPSPSTEADPVPVAAPVSAVVPQRLLAAVDDQVAWRAVTGSCPEVPALPELSTDGGVIWTVTDATTPTGMVALQSILPDDADLASFVGLSSADCTPMFARTFVGGTNYEEFEAGLAGTWFIGPGDRASLSTPSGQVTSPCAVTLILEPATDERAAVLCDDASAFITTDSAATWVGPVRVDGALAVSATPDGYAMAVVGDAACVGVRIVALTDALATTPGGCFATTEAPAGLAGQTALSEAGGVLWLWAGSALVRSTDGGVTWR